MLGKKGGAASVALGPENMPSHRHTLQVAAAASKSTVADNIYASTPGYPLYAAFGATVFAIDSEMIGEIGEGEAHSNIQPSLARLDSLPGLTTLRVDSPAMARRARQRATRLSTL
ncbi:hypothetical protein [Prosthecomicrobium pneumaticum]|uniref:Microcystin-dependent protein n=1 Tax=Prosthecomicrobium pneumaticum TaxID=81895 RepID=A0A7W9L2X3_9HYPH|nr:hypothetical protein [Prosthecomicrobium pneumaticum]MBB5753924.1 microcystin-dependent protein [Prosthecomicrobium pneumaticum]